MAPKNPKQLHHTTSPFFAPSTPHKLVQVSTPGGSRKLIKRGSADAKEHKSSVSGAASNLVNAIIGAGIVGIPFAIRETGLISGILLVILCAFLTDKSLRVLVGTAKHIDVPSYEMLFESTYGSFGFYFISINMLIMAYGGCLSYLTIIKDTLPVLLGVDKEDVGMQRSILTLSTLCVILPISMQRDVADLAKTSQISVVFQCLTVLVVVVFSPISSSLQENGGFEQIASQSIIKTNSIFIGLGVLSFAFVCQHSAFIVAGSLERPTRERWGKVTGFALSLCVILEGSIGIAGYLAFLENTQGNILNNFLSLHGDIRKAANIARGLLCTTMFFVYPMDSFVCRHVLVVLLFRGRRAHEGDDAAVLSRRDRRVAMTLVIYISSLIPALVVDNVGSVLAITGTIAGSSLSYIGPGLVYLAVYGDEFLQKVDTVWGDSIDVESNQEADSETANLLEESNQSTDTQRTPPLMLTVCKQISWYVLMMPIWCTIATVGRRKLKLFQEREALKSPHINRLGKIKHAPMPRASSSTKVEQLSLMTIHQGEKIVYGAVPSGNQAIGAAILAKNKSDSLRSTRSSVEPEEDADIDTPPTWYDFGVAIFLVAFGMVALGAGLVSILMT